MWGMSFVAMPELLLSCVYPLALGSMLAVARLMVWTLGKKGSFD